MKIEEFKKSVEVLDYEVHLDPPLIVIRKDERRVAQLFTNIQYELKTYNSLYITEELFNLLNEYVSTPPEEREDPKKNFWVLEHNGKIMFTEEEYEEIRQELDIPNYVKFAKASN